MRKINFQTKASKKREIEKANPFRNILGIGYGFSLAYFINALFKYHHPSETEEGILLISIIEAIFLFICIILITIISYNVKQNKVFVNKNANLIKLIGVVMMISSFIPAMLIYLGCIHHLSGNTVNYYLFIIGYFIIAIGYIFQKAVKMKEEQDLTI